jgi:hypothetical protein
MIKSYRELHRLRTFEERFDYLKMGGVVGRETFGFERYFNQNFYHSNEWKHTRRNIIIRDKGCDLGISNREIFGRIIIHHINPITVEDIRLGNDCIFDPDNLICCSHNTSNALHYGDKTLLSKLSQERQKGDTRLWQSLKLI